MKAWLSIFLFAGLAACAKNGAGNNVALPSVSSCASPNLAIMASPSAPSHDPYANFGKVILAQDQTLQAKRSGELIGLESSVDDPVLSQGSEFSVTLREACDLGGEISSSIEGRAVNPMTPTPSGVRSYIWKLNRALSLSDLKSIAQNDACVVGISESVQAKATSVISTLGDPLVAQQGHLTMLGASDAYRVLGLLPIAGKPITIAVIDTGIDMNHPDLKNILWRNPGEIAGNGIDDEGNGYVDDVYGYNFATDSGSPQYAGTWSGDQHGTHVSGLAAAQGGNGVGGSGVIGTSARIMMLNVFGPHTGANVSDTANAIRYAADNGASVINLSIGGSGASATYESAIAYAISKGVIVIAAAGNESTKLSPSFFEAPGSYAKEFSGMIAVGSVDSSTRTLSTYSNYGTDYVKLAAPGAENSRSGYGLLSTWPGGSYVRIQGTSMSSPVTAGAAAFAIMMMRQRGYNPSPMTIANLLQTTADHVSALDPYIAGGRALSLINLANFINQTYSVSGSATPVGDPGVPGVAGCP